MGRCADAPTCEVGHAHVDRATPEAVLDAVREGRTHAVLPEYEALDAYRAGGGYVALARLREGGDWEAVQARVKASGLRGLGAAGFPSGTRWGSARGNPGPRHLAVNGDEGEPGTFIDRHYLERTPHLFLEGMLIAAWAVGAERCYVYMRDEYPSLLEILAREVAALEAVLEAAGLIAPGYIEVRRGAGAYICGEESAMIEGKRGLPRHRPPLRRAGRALRPPDAGARRRYAALDRPRGARGAGSAVRSQAERAEGAAELLRLGPRARSRRARPAGREHDPRRDRGGRRHGGGPRLHRLPAGRSASGLLPASLDDVPLDFDTLQPHGSSISSSAVVVPSNHDSARGAALDMLRFFEREGRGQCTPCRSGCRMAVELKEADVWDAALAEIADVMADAGICGLGQAAPNPIRLTLKYFREEVGR